MILVADIPLRPQSTTLEMLNQVLKAEKALHNGPYKSRLATMRNVLMVAYGRPVKTEIETRQGLKAGSLLISPNYVTAFIAPGIHSTLNCFDIPETIEQLTVVDEGSAISGSFLRGSRILRNNTIMYVVAPGEHAKAHQQLVKTLDDLNKFRKLAGEQSCTMPKKKRIALTPEQKARELMGNLRQMTCPEEAGILGYLSGKNLVRVFGTKEAQEQLRAQLA